MGITMGGAAASATGAIDSYLGAMKMGAVAAKEAQSTDVKDTAQQAQVSTAQQMGDRVDVSAQGQHLAKSFAGPRDSTKSTDEKKSKENEEGTLVKSIKERVEEIREEIKELETSQMPEKEKQQQIAMLTQELALQTEMLEKAQGGSNKRYGEGGLIF